MAEYFKNTIPSPSCPIKYNDDDWEEVTTDGDVNYTVSYYPKFDVWFSYHDYRPYGIFATRNNLFSFNDKKLYIHNQSNFCKFYHGEIFKSLLSPVLKSPYISNTKTLSAVFVNITFRTDVIDDKKVRRDKTFNRISFHNSYQSSDKITLVPFDPNVRLLSQYDSYNVRLIHNYWQLNKLRDLKLNKVELTWEEWESTKRIVFSNSVDEIDIKQSNLSSSQDIQMKRRLVDDYLIALIEYDNDEQLQFVLHDLGYLTTPALR